MSGGSPKEKRSAQGSAAHCVTILLRWLNYVVIAGSVASIALILAVRLHPTLWGWGFLIFSCLTFFSGLVGCISAVRTGCYSLHMFLAVTSTTIQGAVSLLLFSRPDMALDHLQSSRSDYDAKILLKMNAGLLLGIFCIQIVVLVLACMAHYCEPTDYYVDLEGNSVRRGRNLARVQEEITLAETTPSKEEESEVAKLNKKMKEKYSKKKLKEEEFDSVEI